MTLLNVADNILSFCLSILFSYIKCFHSTFHKVCYKFWGVNIKKKFFQGCFFLTIFFLFWNKQYKIFFGTNIIGIIKMQCVLFKKKDSYYHVRRSGPFVWKLFYLYFFPHFSNSKMSLCSFQSFPKVTACHFYKK